MTPFRKENLPALTTPESSTLLSWSISHAIHSTPRADTIKSLYEEMQDYRSL